MRALAPLRLLAAWAILEMHPHARDCLARPGAWRPRALTWVK
jgi:hypothetical protein